MMNIIYKSRDFDNREMYAMTMNAGIEKMSNHAGEVINIVDAVVYEDETTKGDMTKILSVRTSDGDILATNSPTVIRTFERMTTCFNNQFPLENVVIKPGISKGGRNFIDLALQLDA